MALALLVIASAGCGKERLPTAPPAATGPPLLLVFVSSRPPSNPFVTDVYVADLARGDPPARPPNLDTPSNERMPALSADAHWLAFFTDRLLIGSLAQLLLYDVDAGRIHVPRAINTLESPFNPSLSSDGRFLASQYQVGGPFDQYITIADVPADTLLPVPTVNEFGSTNFDPSISGDGTLVAFASNGSRSVGAFDILLYSVPADSFIPLPGLNTTNNELSASISGDGRYIAFQSGRPGGVGIIDVYVYDRRTASLLPLPGANTDLSDYQPSISPDGRYLVFVTDAEGAGDIRLYDIQAQRLVPLPGINDPYFLDQMPIVVSRPPS